MQTELIIINEYCRHSHVEPGFLELLEESGLIDILNRNNERYLLVSQLPRLERYTRMYYDISINIEGIDAIRHMLDRMEVLQQELAQLRKQLSLYHREDFEEADW
ncbi:MAG: chaperone modulator CbpM [Bacteroides sp.]|nr:chaperone modulator CbpM [Bacteroides sp.]